MEERTCIACNAPEIEKRLTKCTVCYRPFCEDCGSVMSGRRFCSQYCAEYFFYGGDEDL